MANGDGGVTYTVKELIGMLERTLSDQISGITKRLDSIDSKLDSKADIVRIEAVESRASALEKRMGDLEVTSAVAAGLTKFQRTLVGGFTLLVSGAIGELIYLAAHGGHG